MTRNYVEPSAPNSGPNYIINLIKGGSTRSSNIGPSVSSVALPSNAAQATNVNMGSTSGALSTTSTSITTGHNQPTLTHSNQCQLSQTGSQSLPPSSQPPPSLTRPCSFKSSDKERTAIGKYRIKYFRLVNLNYMSHSCVR